MAGDDDGFTTRMTFARSPSTGARAFQIRSSL
jgi:hypothetical protein